MCCVCVLSGVLCVVLCVVRCVLCCVLCVVCLFCAVCGVVCWVLCVVLRCVVLRGFCCIFGNFEKAVLKKKAQKNSVGRLLGFG